MVFRLGGVEQIDLHMYLYLSMCLEIKIEEFEAEYTISLVALREELEP